MTELEIQGVGEIRKPWAVRLALGLAAGLFLFSGPVLAGTPVKGQPGTSRRPSLKVLHARVDGLLEREGLTPYKVGLLLFSTRERRYLYRRNIEQPLVAASNTKLVTAYASLRVLSPDYRWRTRFYRVDEQDDAKGTVRQGLLVRGSGDPTVTVRDLDRIALVLKSHGLHRIDGGLYFNDRVFDTVRWPASWGKVNNSQSWAAPVSPFIVEQNTVDFIITNPAGARFEIYPLRIGFPVVSRLRRGDVEEPQIRVEQSWTSRGATFTFIGTMPASNSPMFFSTAVKRPVVYFHALLRDSLHGAGITGKMPLKPVPAGDRDNGGLRTRLLYTQYSPPLRDVLAGINRNSNNLGAEVLLRTLALGKKRRDVSAEDGLRVLNRLMRREFPRSRGQFHVVDGSGLSTQDRLSPLFIVRLLNRALSHFAFRAEFVNSLSLAGQDGTLQYRDFPERLRGRLRAKSGTLEGVSNLSGYLQTDDDVMVFSFLINGAERATPPLQKAQDRVLVGIYDALTGRDTPDGATVRPGKPSTPPPPLPPPRTASAKSIRSAAGGNAADRGISLQR